MQIDQGRLITRSPGSKAITTRILIGAMRSLWGNVRIGSRKGRLFPHMSFEDGASEPSCQTCQVKSLTCFSHMLS